MPRRQIDLALEHGLDVRYHVGAHVAIRSEGDALQFDGYATVYDTPYDVAGGPPYGWTEVILAGAGKRTLNTKPDVRLLVNHEGLPLARTRSGTLELTEEDRGLRTFAPSLDRANPLVQEVASGMTRGDVDEMSFAFRVTRQEWNGDYTERTIIEYSLDVDGSDVSIVTYPANKATIAQIRDAVKIDELRASTRSTMDLSLVRAVRDQLRRSA